MEDEDGNIHLRNLSVYLAANEEEALNYLFLGDTNRAISETAMNKASSRSHCIFTISVEGRKHGSDKVMRSKLHLVDLAGSERVHKTQTGGQTLVEAKHINVSLFFLEMVIVALRERGAKGRRVPYRACCPQHIPYRNSMMTSVLRDSLGGNCKTVMIATVNAETAQTEESISTCRFAQRVSTIKNDARVNEDVDPEVLIRRLRSDNATLSDEGETGDGEELTSEEAEDLKDRCRAFVEDPAPSAQLSIGAYTLTKLKRCFSVFKAMVLDGGRALSTGDAHSQGHDMIGEGGPAEAMTKLAEGATGELGGQLLSLRDALRQRDNEIAILVNMLKQGKCHACAAAPSSATPGATTGGGLPPNRQHDPGGENASPQHHNRRSPLPGAAAVGAATGASGGKLLANDEGAGRVVVAPKGTVGGREASGRHRGGSVGGVERPSDGSVLGDPQRAFGYFRERHSGRVALEENKKLLGEKYARAKAMGERVNQARSTIQYLKNTIEQVRTQNIRRFEMKYPRYCSFKGATQTSDSPPYTPATRSTTSNTSHTRKSISRILGGMTKNELRELKSEIEHIQRLLEKGRSKMQADFQAWYEPLACSVEEEDGAVASEGSRVLGEGGTKPKAQSFGGGDDKPRAAHHPAPQGHRQAVVRKTTRERQSEESATFDGSGKDGANTPTRRPRPPVDAWGTPPDSTSRRRGPPSSVATGSVSGGDGGGSNSESAPTSGGGRGAWHGGAGGGGLLPPLTGNKEADDDIAAFYRAKEELERRKSAAGRNSGGR
ncbi:unnamed protein product [Ectocarpus sp. 8 AP-2014]